MLNTGRIRDQWHTMTRTGLSARLSEHCPEPYVSIHPEDAKRNNLDDNLIAVITSQYGQAAVRVNITTDVKPGDYLSQSTGTTPHPVQVKFAA